jgi:plasmid stabilization system protein ParE
VVTEIYQKVQILQSFPRIGYEYENSQDKEIRILLYGHYRIAYLIKDENTIDILGVFHGALDTYKIVENWGGDNFQLNLQYQKLLRKIKKWQFMT